MDTERFIRLIEAATDYKARSYSGRYMYGEECVGFSCEDASDFLLDMDNVGFSKEERKELRNHRTDQLGMRYIIYFPAMKWEEPASDK